MVQKYSGKQISKAGDNLINNEFTNDENLFSEAMDILSFWRFTHTEPLDQAFLYLQETTLDKDSKAIFAKRLKRHISIVEKLKRFDDMKLRGMQDIGGCRAILSTRKKLVQVQRELRKSVFFRDETGKIRQKDYINKPKSDGYRSLHITGKFPDSTGNKRKIEIQLRTFIQHYWATAVEIVDLFTDQALKSNEGEDEWKVFFIRISEQFALMDNIHLFGSLSKKEKDRLYNFHLDIDQRLKESCLVAQKYCEKLDVFKKLEAFAESIEILDDRLKDTSTRDTGYILLTIDMEKRILTSKIFTTDDSQNAETEYIEAEINASASQEKNIVALVSTLSVGNIKEAFPNFFADSTEFLKHLRLIRNVYFPEKPSPFLNDQLDNQRAKIQHKNRYK